MSTNRIITISRQMGSGGREIGQKLAAELGIPFYDKELLARAAKQSGISQSAFEETDEKTTNSLLYSLSMGNYIMPNVHTDYSRFLTGDLLYIEQANAIRQIADEGPCVIVGRCADYVLREYSALVSVFIHADLDIRIKRIMKRESLTDDKAKNYVIKSDKKRANYYEFYSGKDWAAAESYRLCIDVGKLGTDKTIELIMKYSEIA